MVSFGRTSFFAIFFLMCTSGPEHLDSWTTRPVCASQEWIDVSRGSRRGAIVVSGAPRNRDN